MPGSIRYRTEFLRDERGGVAIVFAVSLVVLMLVIGLAIDTARYQNVASRMQQALDGASLAAAKLLADPDLSDSVIEDRANAYFAAAVETFGVQVKPASRLGVTIDRAASSVQVKGKVDVPTYFGGFAGLPSIRVLNQESKVIFDVKYIELALVLDITGSMCATPADAPCLSGPKIDALKTSAKDMIDALFEANTDAGFVKVSLVPYSAAVNAGPYAGTVSGGASLDGCIVERSGATAYTNGYIGPGHYAGVAASESFYTCPPAQIRPLTDLSVTANRDSLKAAIDALMAMGGTAGHIGTAWGWYTLSPEWNGLWPANTARPYDKKTVKAVVLMTDGEFNVSYANGGEAAAWPDPLSADTTVPGTSGYQALQLCEAMKNPADPDSEIVLYTVGFQTPAAAEAVLKQCSGADNYFDANNASQLAMAFRDIVRRLTNLRVAS